MAAPAALTTVAKKLILDALIDPEKTLKLVLLIILIPLLILLLIFTIPIALITSVPVILLEGNTNTGLTNEQLAVVGIYQDAPNAINESNLIWIEEQKEAYVGYDDIIVTYNYDLTWQHLMAIDSVKLNQNFTNVDRESVLGLGEKFLQRNVSTETYQVKEIKTKYYIDPDGTVHSESYTKTVTKDRARINVTTKTFDEVLKELNFNAYETDLIKNIYDTIISSDIEGNLNIYDDIDLSNLKEYPPGTANIPYFNQADKRWGYYDYGTTGTIASSGCGPTALAMVVAGLTGREDINPKSVADWSVANGYRAEGAGSYWSLMTDGGQNYGLQVETVSRMNPERIVQALSQGYPVIASMGRGHFTNGGHFIVLRGITDDGKILVYDPASVSRSQQEWDLSIIMNESSTSGGVNGSPFWIFMP